MLASSPRNQCHFVAGATMSRCGCIGEDEECQNVTVLLSQLLLLDSAQWNRLGHCFMKSEFSCLPQTSGYL